MFKRFLNRFYLFLLLTILTTYAEITVHVLHPWKDNPDRLENGLYVQHDQNWYPGDKMAYEGANWFSFTFENATQETNSRFELVSYIKTQYVEFDSSQKYPGSTQMIFQEIFSDHPDHDEVWITIDDLSSDPLYSFIPPESKVLFFYKPWDLGGVIADIKNLTKLKLRGYQNSCKWFRYNHMDTSEEVLVRFFNSLDSTSYALNGTDDTNFINLSEFFKSSDTLWIYPDPLPSGAPAVVDYFPGIEGNCDTITVAAILRDKAEEHPDFQNEECNGHLTGMVKKRLSDDGKPVKTDTACTSEQFDDWFIAETFESDHTNEKCHNLILTKNSDGLYEYDTDAFYPLDDFQYLDENGTVPNPNYSVRSGHNYYFTMEMECEFEYKKGQTFYFRGDDDVWVFIDSSLVVDIGGVHGPVSGAVDLDTLELTEGSTYNFKLFFAERHCCGSNFRIVTSIDLRTSSRLFYETDTISEGIIQYDMYEKITSSNLSCNFSEEPTDTIRAVVKFTIEGPSFEYPQQLSSGTSFGGITISADFSTIVIDESALTELDPGNYIVRFSSQTDPSQGGAISFTVKEQPKPHRITNPILHASYYCENGYGKVDRAEIYFEHELNRLPDSILFSWPSILDSKIIYPKDMFPDTLNKKQLTVVFPDPFEQEITTFSGSNRLGISYSYDTTFSDPVEIIHFNIEDSVGPLLRSATLVESSGEQDTILLTFTEPVKPLSITGNSLLLIKPDTFFTLDVEHLEQFADTFKVIITKTGEYELSKGDSIKIYSSGPLTDLFNNKAHPLNRPVPLLIREKMPQIIYSFYSDTDADGFVDECMVEFDKAVNLSEISYIISWSTLLTDTISEERLRYGIDSAHVVINIKNAFEDMDIMTSGRMNALFIDYSFPQVASSFFIEDSAAPVLISATLYPATPDTNRSLFQPDTLEVVLSEIINISENEEPFLFKKSSGIGYNVSITFLRQSGNRYLFLVKETKPDSVYFSAGDSVWINPTASICDPHKNFQSNSMNRRALLNIRPAALQIKISWGPNPFNPRKNSSFKVQIDPFIKTRESVNIKADFFIYDAVGNLVHSQKKESKKSNTSMLTFIWNGRNRYGRIAGSGTYLGIVRAEDITNPANNESVKFFIGISR